MIKSLFVPTLINLSTFHYRVPVGREIVLRFLVRKVGRRQVIIRLIVSLFPRVKNGNGRPVVETILLGRRENGRIIALEQMKKFGKRRLH